MTIFFSKIKKLIPAILLLPFTALADDGNNGLNNLNATVQGTALEDRGEIAIFIGVIIKGFLGLLGVVFLCLFIYGGYVWTMAQGDSSKVDKAKKIITASAVGLIITISAYALTNLIINSLI